MDNTIVRSKIDFGRMKGELFDFLTAQGVIPPDFPVDQHTSASMIDHARRTPSFPPELLHELWNICAKHEAMGMKDADLEPGVIELLDRMHNKRKLVILTNNSHAAAIAALERNNIDHYFEHVIAREQVQFMKPAPDGVHAILNLYSDTTPEEWISVGDAWIDGKASQDAGVKFVSYQGDAALMRQKGVHPAGSIDRIGDLLQYLD